MPHRLAIEGWDHPRGLGALRAVAELFQLRRRDRIDFSWAPQTLAQFGAGAFDFDGADLVLLDHPATAELAPQLVELNGAIPASVLEDIDRSSIGATAASYVVGSERWALPFDASCQVDASRPAGAASKVTVMATSGTSLWCVILSHLAAGLTDLRCETIAAEPALLTAALDALRKLRTQVDIPASLPSAAELFERVGSDSRARRITNTFAYRQPPGLPAFDYKPIETDWGPVAGILGGAGLGVSRRGANRNLAIEFALFCATGDAQREVLLAGGQPARQSAWAGDQSGLPALIARAPLRSNRVEDHLLQKQAAALLRDWWLERLSDHELRNGLYRLLDS
jgi:multiple sugar transport system substrate-binding protein